MSHGAFRRPPPAPSPFAAPPLPITDELPAVLKPPPKPAGPGGPGPSRWLSKLLVLLIVVGAIALAAIMIGSNNDELATANDADITVVATVVETTADDANPIPTIGSASTAEPLALEAPGWWQVVNVEQGLNVRAEPGTGGAPVGSLSAGTRGVYATGERASVNGSEWKQIRVGDTLGWVSANFLSPDDGPAAANEPAAIEGTIAAEPEPSTTTSSCYQGLDELFMRTVQIDVDGDIFEGLIRIDRSGEPAVYETVAGPMPPGRAGKVDTAIINTATNRQRLEEWRFGPSSLTLAQDFGVNAVDCQAVEALLP